ncbi:phosphotransferase [Nonomuraea sp. MCN248]|uniref:Phosphotransferase n=1 Tax=Nonomuraea corallina TaxID=2989783 RepID=A0ABT4S6Q0_9ACTN|nr:phosphotransferase [Nonomuraea corallina]MDA0632610.1 phosphotransferase [Nonomuraea corallina]
MVLEAELAGVAGTYGGSGDPVRHQTRSDSVVVRRGEVVVKAHSVRDDVPGLRARLRACASPELAGVMLAPLVPEVLMVAGRAVTVWPAGRPIGRDETETAPWEEGARLLARLHAAPLTSLPALPEAGGPGRAAGAVRRLEGDGPVERLIRRTFQELPEPEAGPALLTHGDWHLGQLVLRDRWLLIDPDDLGVGDPAWDLARPAAWYAAGLLDPEVWDRFLGAYLAAGGPALGDGDPWRRLDLPARAVTAQLAAVALGHARRERRELDEAEQSLIEACGRIVRA